MSGKRNVSVCRGHELVNALYVVGHTQDRPDGCESIQDSTQVVDDADLIRLR